MKRFITDSAPSQRLLDYPYAAGCYDATHERGFSFFSARRSPLKYIGGYIARRLEAFWDGLTTGIPTRRPLNLTRLGEEIYAEQERARESPKQA